MQLQTIVHTIPPLYDSESRVLLLGSIPSPKSREVGFFYGHPQNRFWRVLAAVLGEEVPVSIEDKRAMCLRHHVALWDTIAKCDIAGASDTSIRNAEPNDIGRLLRESKITRIFATGGKSAQLYRKLIEPKTGVPITQLPSTSPANAAWSLETADRSVPRYSLIRGVFFTSKELFPNAALKKLILPLVIEQVLAITVGLADTMMVSSVGEAAVSGVSLVDMLNVLIINIFSALATGGAVVVAQLLGARKNDRACDASKQLYLVVTVIALIISALVMLFRAPLLRLLFGTIEDRRDAQRAHLSDGQRVLLPRSGDLQRRCGAVPRTGQLAYLHADCGTDQHRQPHRQLAVHFRVQVGRRRRSAFVRAVARHGGCRYHDSAAEPRAHGLPAARTAVSTG